ncbi:hypothetical protein A1O3_06065 [Capronia epimyces CBS 606.96]|uniref:Choline transport protein n=1 Tax=Capronia epimyces CBS 606.96 TaxID=1182542 RepID=W9XNX5_9EURO|nr:uncharacterized protein A1O3_06065 [Capronia epimyces CBS 606.96]EXJ82252.1 hypothetical protein A1O3_06065 [Capronia epimyces CBS 606.96]
MEKEMVATHPESSVDVDVEVAEVVIPPKELDRPFRLWSSLGMQFSVSSTPLAIGTYLSFVIGIGGSPVFFFGYLLACVMGFCICLSLAEIAAVYPHASGQIYWTATLMPKKYSRGLSYVTGWLACCGWFFGTAGCLLITSELIWALVNVCHSAFIIQPWHFYLGYVAAGIFGLSMNIPLFRIYPHMLNSLVLLVNGGALFVLIALLVRAHPKQPASYVFTDIVNATGWSGNGVVFFIGLLPGITAVTGFDTAAHLTDELPNPKKQVPQVMVGGAVICALSGIPMILVYMFCIVKPDNLLAPVGGQPIIQLMLDSFDSLALTILGTLVFILGFGSTCATVMTVWTRTWWSFARENGVPFSGTMSRINEYYRLPVNTICFCFGLLCCLGLIELGSSTALNAILGGLILCLYSSYCLAILGLLIGRRKALRKDHYLNLGRFGTVVNVVSVGWILMMIVWLSFPLYLPVTSESMNYASAVFAAVLLCSTVNWFVYSRHIYKAPVAMYEDQEEDHEHKNEKETPAEEARKQSEEDTVASVEN